MNSETVTFWPDEDPVHAQPVHRADAPVTTVLRPCVLMSADEPITLAWNRMRDHGELALVVDESAHAVGLLGLREVSAVWPGRPPLRGEPTAGEAVRNVRTSGIRATASIRVAIRQLIADRQGAAPVVTADGRALGVVTALDLLTALSGERARRDQS